jgi:hypothetical protein
MKRNGFLLLHGTSKVQNVVFVVSCIQNLKANLHKYQATKRKAQPRRKWRAQRLEQNQEGSINAECKAQKHKVTSKA